MPRDTSRIRGKGHTARNDYDSERRQSKSQRHSVSYTPAPLPSRPSRPPRPSSPRRSQTPRSGNYSYHSLFDQNSVLGGRPHADAFGHGRAYVHDVYEAPFYDQPIRNPVPYYGISPPTPHLEHEADQRRYQPEASSSRNTGSGRGRSYTGPSAGYQAGLIGDQRYVGDELHDLITRMLNKQWKTHVTFTIEEMTLPVEPIRDGGKKAYKAVRDGRGGFLKGLRPAYDLYFPTISIELPASLQYLVYPELDSAANKLNEMLEQTDWSTHAFIFHFGRSRHVPAYKNQLYSKGKPISLRATSSRLMAS
ncbi:hypothetical protein GGS20DRAFT_594968 [Poronia punctata]|nr:hypothetical protein GGS20DRAFT_594968 [Poronia punctata]